MGSPRSGTTLVSSYIGSAAEVLDLGEYGAFYLTYRVVPREMSELPGGYKHQYLKALSDHAHLFASERAKCEGCIAYCDSTPLNLLIGSELLGSLPNAFVVLLVRNPIGVIQSLGRSFASGYRWAGRSLEDRAQLYQRFYEKALDLPRDRLICVSYDALCHETLAGVRKLTTALSAFEIDTAQCDLGLFTISHATDPVRNRPRLAERDENGTIVFKAIPSHDRVRWRSKDLKRIWKIVGDTVDGLRSLPGLQDAPGLLPP